MRQPALNAQQRNFTTATDVQQAGIHAGDEIAYIGNPMYAFWAKLDRVRIVADAPSNYRGAGGESVPVSTPFWQSPESQQAAIFDALRNIGIKAILRVKPSKNVPSGWQQVGDTDRCVKFLN